MESLSSIVTGSGQEFNPPCTPRAARPHETTAGGATQGPAFRRPAPGTPFALVDSLIDSLKQKSLSERRGADVYIFKCVRAGKIMELYEYERPQVRYLPEERGSKSGPVNHSEGRRLNNCFRSKQSVRRLINANDGQYGHRSVFLTLTFADDVRSLDVAHYEFKKGILRINYHYDLKLKYAAVPEFQDKTRAGVLHYHLCCFNLPFVNIPELEKEVWQRGRVELDVIDQVRNIGSYMTKYMTKDNGDRRLDGRKSYFCSRGLRDAVTTIDPGEIVVMVENWGEPVYMRSYESDHVGRVTYRQFICDGR